MKLLHEYNNGNTQVKLYEDGTKIREYEGVPQPEFFESCDVKITNVCDGPLCSYCHEKSGPNESHADLNALKKLLSPIQINSELAIGGGDIFRHPELHSFLSWAHQKGLIANITINHRHLAQYSSQLLELISSEFVRGVGVSYNSSLPMSDITPLLQASDNIVFHLIMGVNTIEDIENLIAHCSSLNKKCKILILGYKDYGYGKKYLTNHSDAIEYNKYQYYIRLASFFKSDNLVLSFDNLAIKQLKLQRYFMKDAWEKFFMGNDGTFTMYIDAVKQEYAVSSTSVERVSWKDKSLLEFFKGIKHD